MNGMDSPPPLRQIYHMDVRTEHTKDAAAIRALVTTAFAGAAHSSGAEAAIVEALRAAGALTLSLVAEDRERIVGHVAFSPVTINGAAGAWFGLGPVAVMPDAQGRGIGQRLISDGLDRLRGLGAMGCVVLGEPDYYRRFGFESDPTLFYPGVPASYFQRLAFTGTAPRGEIAYHDGFSAA